MTQDAVSKDPLLQPFQLKSLRLKNRVISTSHAISYGVEAKPQERYQRYHEEKAKGGIGMTMFGGSSNIDVDSASVFGQLFIGSDDIIPVFQQFSDRIHKYDCALMCQITHMGRRTTAYGDNWFSPVAPSRVREKLHRGFPREMDMHDITRIVKSFGDAAWRCKEGGLDGCEVIAASHLVGQFLSPHTNQRTDGFGGSLENRARFGRMVFDEIRNRVGDDFIVGIRMPALEGGQDGLLLDESIQIAQMFEAAGAVDFFNLNYGRMDTELSLAEQNMPGMSVKLSPFLETVGAFRKEISSPVLHAARITEIATARHAVSEGIVDLVGMTRAHIADPHIVNKIAAGQEDRIRACVGATYCSSPRRACIQNAATGREQSLSHIITPVHGAKRKAVVVGGGPAGMEAARVSAERGHDVVLLEAANKLGGQVLIAAQVDWRRDMLGITDWLAQELEILGVEIHYNCYAEKEDVLRHNPDVVILATGGLPNVDGFVGAEHCMSVWDAISAPVRHAKTAIVYDELGQMNAATCCETLVQSGIATQLITSQPQFALDAAYLERAVQRKRLYERDVDVVLDYRLVKVVRKGQSFEVTFSNTLTQVEKTHITDLVVVEAGTLPMEDLFDDLKESSVNAGVTNLKALVKATPQNWPQTDGEYELHRIGDAVTSRDIHAAIYDANRLCAWL